MSANKTVKTLDLLEDERYRGVFPGGPVLLTDEELQDIDAHVDRLRTDFAEAVDGSFDAETMTEDEEVEATFAAVRRMLAGGAPA